jgi:hypothetical protein
MIIQPSQNQIPSTTYNKSIGRSLYYLHHTTKE